ncbi:MAG: DUF5777 family beta-barrel protein [Fulvivirga sp.]|nr:DUF5777 family beta-barrel protein [Fulvivirga sp.]
MKNFLSYLVTRISLMALLGLCSSSFLAAQDTEMQEDAPDHRAIRPPFESIWLIDNQTSVVPTHKTFQFDIMHRFGLVENGLEDLYGLYAPSNIRLGFSYVPIENIAVGFGFTKNRKPVDFSIKYAALQQTRSNKIPVSVTYFGSALADTRDGSLFFNSSDRYSFFHQVIISRKFTHRLSIQVAPSVTHFNLIEESMEHDHIAAAVGGRFRVSPQSSVIFNYDQPITQHDRNNPNPNISFGLEVSTSSHAFQVFLGNYSSLNPQYNNVFNQNNYEDGEFLIGFNITRRWNF